MIDNDYHSPQHTLNLNLSNDSTHKRESEVKDQFKQKKDRLPEIGKS